MDEISVLVMKGRHAASDSMVINTMPDGSRSLIKNLKTRIDPQRVHVSYSASEEGILLRIDDDDHQDFWLEFALDIPTLELLLAKAKGA